VRWPVLSLLILLAAIALGLVVQWSPGRVSFFFSGWVVDIGMPLFVLILVALFFALRECFSLWDALRSAPERIRRSVAAMRGRRERVSLQGALRALLEGDWPEAERRLHRSRIGGAGRDKLPLPYCLGLAVAARRQGKDSESERLLRQAEAGGTEGRRAAAIVRARLYADAGRTAAAIECLERLRSVSPKDRRIGQLLLELYLKGEDWQSVLSQAADLPLSSRERFQLRLQAYRGLIRALGEKGGDAQALESLWQGLPAALRRDTGLLKEYARACLRFSTAGNCEPALRKALKKRYVPELALLYGALPDAHSERQLRLLQGLLQRHPRDAQLLLAAGLLSMRLEMQGKAEGYLERSAELSSTPEVHYALAKLRELQHDRVEAAEHYRKGMELFFSRRRGSAGPPLLPFPPPGLRMREAAAEALPAQQPEARESQEEGDEGAAPAGVKSPAT